MQQPSKPRSSSKETAAVPADRAIAVFGAAAADGGDDVYDDNSGSGRDGRKGLTRDEIPETPRGHLRVEVEEYPEAERAATGEPGRILPGFYGDGAYEEFLDVDIVEEGELELPIGQRAGGPMIPMSGIFGDNVDYATLTPQGAQTTVTPQIPPVRGGEMSPQIPPVAATPMITPRALSFDEGITPRALSFGLLEEEEEGSVQEAAYTMPPPPPPPGGLPFLVDPEHELSTIATRFLNKAASFSDQGQQHQEQSAFCVLDSKQRIIGLTPSWAQKVGLVFHDEAGPESQFPLCAAAAVGKNIREVVGASDSAACPKALGEYLDSLGDLFRGHDDLDRLRQDQDSQAAVTYYLNDCAQNCAEGQVIEFPDQFHWSSQMLYTGHTRICWLIAAQDRKGAAVKEKAFLLDLRGMTDQRRVDLMPSSPCSASADYQ